MCECVCPRAPACAGGSAEGVGGRLEDICWDSLGIQECFKRQRQALATPTEVLLGKQDVWGCSVSEHYLRLCLFGPGHRKPHKAG